MVPDDPPRKPYPRAQTGTERDIEGLAALRARTPAKGIPMPPGLPRGVPIFVEPDDEKTPVAVTIADIARQPITQPRTVTQSKEIEAISRITTPQGQIEALAAAVASHADALDYERQRRHKLEQHGEDIAEIKVLLGRVIDSPAKIGQLTESNAAVLRQMSAIAASLDRLGREQERDNAFREQSDRAWDRAIAQLGAAQKESAIQSKEISLLSQRVDTMNVNLRDDAARTRGEVESHARRLNSLETRNKISVALTRKERAGLAVGGLGAGGAGYGLVEFVKWIISLAHH